MRRRENNPRAGETSFRNAKLPRASLIADKVFADLVDKWLFVITIACAHRLSAEAFRIFPLGSTLAWVLAVTTDFASQLRLAREVARRPDETVALLPSWPTLGTEAFLTPGCAVALVMVHGRARDIVGEVVTRS